MAMLLKDRDSTDRHLNAGRRHMRLCQEVPGCDQFSASIQPALQNLEAKAAVTKSKIIIRENTLDTLKLRERIAEKKIRTLFERCLQHDRDNIGSHTVEHLFPEGRRTPYVTGERKRKVDMMEQIAKRGEALAADHPLQETITDLKSAIAGARELLAQYSESQLAVKLVTAEEQIAQTNVRRTYEANYLDARKLYGKDVAESIFPDLRTAKEPESTVTPPAPVAAA